MNITIKPGAATEDAAQIDSIVSIMEQDMQKLNEVITTCIPDGVMTDWSDSLRANWERYYNDGIPEAMEAMKASAENLRIAIEKALDFSREGN